MANTYQLYTPEALEVPPLSDPRWLTYGEPGGMGADMQFFKRTPGPIREFEDFSASAPQIVPPQYDPQRVPGEMQSLAAIGAGGALQYVGNQAAEAVKAGADPLALSTHTGAAQSSWNDLKNAATSLFPESPAAQLGQVGGNIAASVPQTTWSPYAAEANLTPAAVGGIGTPPPVTLGNLPPPGPPAAYPAQTPAISGAAPPVVPGWHAPAVSGVYSAAASLVMDVLMGQKPNLKKAAGAGVGGVVGFALGGPIGAFVGSTVVGSFTGRVICTELHAQGLMPKTMQRLDLIFTRRLSPAVVRGYHLMAPTVVNVMRRSPLMTRLVAPIAVARGHEIMYQMGFSERPNLLGKGVRVVFEGLCLVVGTLIPIQRDWRKLYASV